MSGIDLHTHSSFSDGVLTPRELVRQAKERGLTAISITDHDILEGQDETLAAGQEFGLRIITGIELSVDFEHGSLHLLGYGFDHRNQQLRDTVEVLRLSREDRNERIIAKLEDMGYQLTRDEVLAFSTEGTYGRAHIAQALVASKQMGSVEEAFNRLLTKGGPAYLDRKRLPLRDAVVMIHNAGGIAVWAHPGTHGAKLENMLGLLPWWVEQGLDGIESDYHDHSYELRDRLRGLAGQLGIIYTGGSDFHGSIKPGNLLGEGSEGDPVGEKILEMLEERLKRF